MNATLYVDGDYYQRQTQDTSSGSKSGSTWWNYDANSTGNSALYGGQASGYYYIAAVHFSLSSYASANVSAATLSMYRFTNQSSAAKTLTVRVGTIDVSGQSYSFVDGTTVTWNVTSGAGTKSVDITSLLPALKAANNRYLLIYGATGQYTEFRAQEETTGQPNTKLDITYTQGLVNYYSGGAWHQCEVYVWTGGGWHKCEPYFWTGGGWHLLG